MDEHGTIYFVHKRTRTESLRRFIRKQWYTKVLGREWPTGWLWYGGYGKTEDANQP